MWFGDEQAEISDNVALEFRRVHEQTDITFERERHESMVERGFKKLKIITYTNKVYLLFPWLDHRNFKV